MYQGKRRRRSRRFKRRLPLYAFYLAVLAFFMAFAFPTEGEASGQAVSAEPVSTLLEPLSTPEPQTIEGEPSGQTVSAEPVSALPGPPSTPKPQTMTAAPAPVDSAPDPDALSTPPDQEPSPTPPVKGAEPEIPSAPAVDKSALILVNPWNPLDQNYSFTPTKLSNGLVVDQRCYPDLQNMMDACRAAGLSPVICSAYRGYEKQEELYQKKVDKLTAQGYSRSSAEAEAAKEVALPGTSEHQLGLAVDIVDLNNQNLDKTQESTAVQKWLMEHSWEYGFILRYPSGSSELTGIIYEPWHYRYVGKEAAAEIYEQGVCLEEYLAA